MSEHFGFIGVGRMGGPMAGRLIDAGHRLTIFDVSEDAMAPLIARGATRAGSAREVAASCETVFVSLPTPDIVREVALRQDGVIAGGTVKTFIELSTTGSRNVAAIAETLARKGIVTVDSPVSGGVTGAKNGTLAVMVACPKELFARLEPALKTFGRVFHVGERPGMGQTMKLANNLLSAAAMAISSEAVVMGVKAGLDPEVMIDVINAGTGRNSATVDKFPRAVLPRTFDFGFATGLMYKDVRLFVEEAENLGIPLWVAPAVRQLWFQACSELGADRDSSAVVKSLERLAKIEVRG